jgi:hypothetical protein
MSRSLLLLLLVVSLLFSVSFSQHQETQHHEADDDLTDPYLNHRLLHGTIDDADVSILSTHLAADEMRFAVQGRNRSQPVYNDTVVRRMSAAVSSSSPHPLPTRPDLSVLCAVLLSSFLQSRCLWSAL